MTRGNENGGDGDPDAFDASEDGGDDRGTGDEGTDAGGPDDHALEDGGLEDSGNDGGESADGDAGNADGGGENDDGADERQIYHRQVTPDADEANRSLLRLVANLERCEVTDLPPLYEQVDHLVEHLFTEPPPPDAQAEIEFSYCGYRIELDQTGDVTFMKLGDETRVVSEE